MLLRSFVYYVSFLYTWSVSLAKVRFRFLWWISFCEECWEWGVSRSTELAKSLRWWSLERKWYFEPLCVINMELYAQCNHLIPSDYHYFKLYSLIIIFKHFQNIWKNQNVRLSMRCTTLQRDPPRSGVSYLTKFQVSIIHFSVLMRHFCKHLTHILLEIARQHRFGSIKLLRDYFIRVLKSKYIANNVISWIASG